jgi:hypothetical protein
VTIDVGLRDHLGVHLAQFETQPTKPAQHRHHDTGSNRNQKPCRHRNTFHIQRSDCARLQDHFHRRGRRPSRIPIR